MSQFYGAPSGWRLTICVITLSVAALALLLWQDNGRQDCVRDPLIDCRGR